MIVILIKTHIWIQYSTFIYFFVDHSLVPFTQQFHLNRYIQNITTTPNHRFNMMFYKEYITPFRFFLVFNQAHTKIEILTNWIVAE